MKYKLKKNWIIFFTIIVAIITALIGVLIISKLRKNLSDNVVDVYAEQEQLIVTQVAEGIEKSVADVESQLKLMALAPEIVNSNNKAICNDKLKQYLAITSYHLGNLGRVDADGKFGCSVNNALVGTQASKLGTYIPEIFNDPEHKTVMSHKIKPPGIQGYAAAIHVPVTKNGKFDGTMGGAIYFDQIKDKYLKNIKVGQTGFAVLLDANGDILYTPNTPNIGKNIKDTELSRAVQPKDVFINIVKNINKQHKGEFTYTVRGVKKVAAFEAIDVPGRRMVAIVTLPLSEVNNVISTVGLNTAFPAIFAVLTLSIGLMTFLMLYSSFKSYELQRAKDEFVSLVSHQLRTPATAVKQYLGLILQGYVKKAKDKNENIQSAYESNDEQLQIIDDILNVAKIDSGKLHIQKARYDLTEQIKKDFAEMETMAKAKGHTMKLEAPGTAFIINADQLKITMSIQNLISNAIKYTPDGGEIKVRLYPFSNNVCVSVEDNGIGISEVDQAKLFNKFTRLNTEMTAKVQGTGLGLYLVKQLIEMHGGKISVGQNHPKGTKFVVELPKEK